MCHAGDFAITAQVFKVVLLAALSEADPVTAATKPGSMQPPASRRQRDPPHRIDRPLLAHAFGR